MKKYALIMAVAGLFAAADGFAWWPFGGDDDDKPRISLLMKPVNELIDQAEDKKSAGAYSEAVDFYRAALNELANVEYANPEMVDTPEFATVKNKRAYINAAITTLQLREADEEDGLVTVSDTTELEKRIAEEKKAVADAERAAEEAKKRAEAEKKKAEEAKKLSEEKKRQSEAAAQALAGRKAAVAKVPADVGALNRFAAKAMMSGEVETAELALKRAIELFPTNHYAYYNLAKLLRTKGSPAGEITEIYQAGRAVGGPVDRELEAIARPAK